MKRLLFYILFILAITTISVSAQEIGASWEFNEDGNSEGWQVNRSLSDLTVADGLLTATIIGYQSSFAGPDSLNIPASEYGFIYIRMQVTDGLWGKIFWKTDSGKSESMAFNIIGDSLFHEYEIAVSSKEKWTDTITEFNKLQVQAPAGVEIKIDYIRVANLGPRMEIVKLRPLRTVVKEGVAFPFELIYQNTGDRPADASFHLSVPDNFQLSSGQESTAIQGIQSGEQDTLIWTLTPSLEGTYSIAMEVNISDSVVADSSVEGTVYSNYWQQDEFILGCWVGPQQTDSAYTEYVNMGFNEMARVSANQQQVDFVSQYGLICLTNIYGTMGGGSYLVARSEEADPIEAAEFTPEMWQALDDIVEQFKDQPTVWGYYLSGEPSLSAFENIGKVIQYVREKDPTRLVYVNLNASYNLEPSEEAMAHSEEAAYELHVESFLDIAKPDMLIWDHYHYRPPDLGDTIYYLYNLEVMRRYSLRYDVPFLNIIQAFMYERKRMPTPNEEAFLVYSTLTYGGKGIEYFLYRTSGTLISFMDPLYRETMMPMVKQLNLEINALAPILMQLTSVGVYSTYSYPPGTVPLPDGEIVSSVSNDADLIIGLFKNEQGADYIMFMNKDVQNAITTTITLSKNLNQLQYFDCEPESWAVVSYENTTEGATFECSLAPGKGLLYNLSTTTAVVENEEGSIPEKFTLSQNYPNPFNPSTTIQYSLPQTVKVKLTVYDVIGRKVAVLVNEKQSAGNHSIVWDAGGIPSGLYLYQFEAGAVVQNRKMLLLK